MDADDQYWAIRDSILRLCGDGRSYFGLIAIGGNVAEELDAEANAHLIAAAPDLLHACNYALQFCDDSHVRAILNAAITRAKGESA
jgi:hypothetical protein